MSTCFTDARASYFHRRIVLRDDPYHHTEGEALEFRLTYDGLLLAGTSSDPRAKHKHDIRKRFHPQLKRLWNLNPQFLEPRNQGHLDDEVGFAISFPRSAPEPPKETRIDLLQQRFTCGDYCLVPLVLEELELVCSIDILFMRPDKPGSLIRSGDIDNRLKVLFDSLRIPVDKKELGGHLPEADEYPFFCLLQDDRLITHLSISTDVLLEPLRGKDQIDDNDVRLIIKVNLRPIKAMRSSIDFI